MTCNETFLFVTDQEKQSKSHQETHERLHGVVADRTSENLRVATWHAQRGDLKETGSSVEATEGGGQEALHGGGGQIAPAAPKGIPGLQVSSQEKDNETHAQKQRGQ